VIGRDLMVINIGKTVTWEREPAATYTPKDHRIEH
jgi:hypothetical protein